MDNSKNKKFTEPGETVDFSKTNQGGEFDTLNTGEEVIQPSGQGAKIVGDTSKLHQPIDAAIHQQETINLNGNGPIPGSGTGTGQPGDQAGPAGPGQSKPDEPFNPEFGKLPEDEQQQNATVAAEAIVEGYCNIWLAVPKLISIKDSTLKKMHKAGEINMHARIPASRASGGTIALVDFIHQFNETQKAPFVTDQEFKDNVIPLLAHELKGKGFAPTPGQMLLYFAAVDSVKKGAAIVQCAKQNRELLNELREFNAQNPGPSSPITADVPPPYETHATPPPPPPMDGNAAVTSQAPPPPPPAPAGDATQALIQSSIRNSGRKKSSTSKVKGKPGPKASGKHKPRDRSNRRKSTVTVLTPVS